MCAEVVRGHFRGGNSSDAWPGRTYHPVRAQARGITPTKHLRTFEAQSSEIGSKLRPSVPHPSEITQVVRPWRWWEKEAGCFDHISAPIRHLAWDG